MLEGDEDDDEVKDGLGREGEEEGRGEGVWEGRSTVDAGGDAGMGSRMRE